MIEIHLNGELREIEREARLSELLERLGFRQRLIAVELNNNVVRRAEWSETFVRDGDKVEVVHFVGGG